MFIFTTSSHIQTNFKFLKSCMSSLFQQGKPSAKMTLKPILSAITHANLHTPITTSPTRLNELIHNRPYAIDAHGMRKMRKINVSHAHTCADNSIGAIMHMIIVH